MLLLRLIRKENKSRLDKAVLDVEVAKNQLEESNNDNFDYYCKKLIRAEQKLEREFRKIFTR